MECKFSAEIPRSQPMSWGRYACRCSRKQEDGFNETFVKRFRGAASSFLIYRFRRTARSAGVSLIIDNELPGKFRAEETGDLGSSRNRNFLVRTSGNCLLRPSSLVICLTRNGGLCLKLCVINSQVRGVSEQSCR